MPETISFIENGNEANPVSDANPLPVYQTSGLSIPVHASASNPVRPAAPSIIVTVNKITT